MVTAEFAAAAADDDNATAEDGGAAHVDMLVRLTNAFMMSRRPPQSFLPTPPFQQALPTLNYPQVTGGNYVQVYGSAAPAQKPAAVAGRPGKAAGAVAGARSSYYSTDGGGGRCDGRRRRAPLL